MALPKRSWDAAPLDISTIVYKQIQDLQRAKNDLTAQRKLPTFGRKTDKYLGKMATLLKDFKQDWLSYDQVFRKNWQMLEKTQRAIVSNLEKQSELDVLLEENRAEVEEYRRMEEVMRRRLADYEVFAKFMEDMLAISPEFANMYGVFGRYQMLEELKHGLSGDILEGTRLQTRGHAEVVGATSEKMSEIERLRNRLQFSYGRLNEVKENSTRWDTINRRTRQAIFSRESSNKAIEDGVRELYNSCCRASGKTADLDEVQQQAHYVDQTINYLHELYRVANELNKSRTKVEGT